MTSNTITIDHDSQGQRLDKFLVEKFPELSRSQIQKTIKSGGVLVNEKKVTVHHFLKAGDKIEIKEIEVTANKERDNRPDKKSKTTKKIDEPKIIAVEPEFLIIEKPAGLLVHPTDKNETDTLADWLVAKYPELKKIGENPQRPAIVHRLDKEVSGLILIPKTQDAFDFFKSQFKQHLIHKEYLTLVEGEVKKDEGEINFPIGRSQTKSGLFAAKPLSQKTEKEKIALTRYQVIQRFKNYTLLGVEILTGRTHQIRVHLLALGHPVVGDQLYGNQKSGGRKFAPSRIFLHATKLSFVDPAGKEQNFISPLPEEMQQVLKNLK